MNIIITILCFAGGFYIGSKVADYIWDWWHRDRSLCSGCNNPLTVHGWENKKTCYNKRCPRYVWKGLNK